MDKIMVLLLIIAGLNLITYISVKDWKSTMILLLAGLITYNTQQEIVLFLGILTAALFRSVVLEGLTTTPDSDAPKAPPKKKIIKNTEPEPSSAPVLSASYIEGLTQKSKELSAQQGGLMEMMTQLGPMMKQAEKMMDKLPEGFLDAAIENLKKK
jgi:hypothetical protein